MKEEDGKSLGQTELRASNLCPCLFDCFNRGDDAQHENQNLTTSNQRETTIIEDKKY